MNKKIKKLWVKALRSGKFEQTTGALYNEGNDGYCCLGVLGKVQGAEDKVLLGAEDNMLSDIGSGICAGLHKRSETFLADCNDQRRWDFKKIANYIEKHY